MDQQPHRPCMAYVVMESVLPERYFLCPLPVSGVRLFVVAEDGVATQ